MTRRKPHHLRLVRIIRDARDATQDYFIPAGRADQLYTHGRLIMVQAYANEWTYATRTEQESPR